MFFKNKATANGLFLRNSSKIIKIFRKIAHFDLFFRLLLSINLERKKSFAKGKKFFKKVLKLFEKFVNI